MKKVNFICYEVPEHEVNWAASLLPDRNPKRFESGEVKFLLYYGRDEEYFSDNITIKTDYLAFSKEDFEEKVKIMKIKLKLKK